MVKWRAFKVCETFFKTLSGAISKGSNPKSPALGQFWKGSREKFPQIAFFLEICNRFIFQTYIYNDAGVWRRNPYTLIRTTVLMTAVLALILVPFWPPATAEAVRPERPATKGSAKSSAEREQLLRAIYPRAPRNLDPHGYPDPAAWPVIMAAYHRLMTFDNGTAKPIPALAKSVVVSPDGLKYTFYLHEGMTFADGTALNSEAALFSFNRLMLSEVGRRYFPYLQRFEDIGAHTFRLILSRPWPPFLASLALPQASLISPDLAHRPDDYLKRHTLGSGPYQVYDWQDETIGLQIRPDQTAAPQTRFVMFHYEPDPRKRLEKALTHQAHLVAEPALPAGALPSQYQFKKVSTFSVRYLAFNTRRPYTGMQNIRRSLSAVLKAAYSDYPGHLDGAFPAGLFYNEPERPTPPALAGSDPLAQAGYVLNDIGPPPGYLTLVYQAEGGLELAAEAQRIVEALGLHGLRINITALKGPEGRRILESGKYDFYLGDRSPDIPSPDMWLGRFLDSTSTVDGNPAFFQHPRADRLIGDIVNTVGKGGDGPGELRQLEADRAAKVAELAELVRTEAPYAFLYQLERKALVDVRLANLSPHPIWPEVWPIDQVSLKPFSFRSGANPTGRAPGVQASPLKSPAVPRPAPPAAPEIPGPLRVQTPPDEVPSPDEIQLTPESVEIRPGQAPSAAPDQVLDYFDLDQLDEPADSPPNPSPNYDDFLGMDMNEAN